MVTLHLSAGPAQSHCHDIVARGKLLKLHSRVIIYTTTHRGPCTIESTVQNTYQCPQQGLCLSGYSTGHIPLPRGGSVPMGYSPAYIPLPTGGPVPIGVQVTEKTENFSTSFILHSLFPSPTVFSQTQVETKNYL